MKKKPATKSAFALERNIPLPGPRNRTQWPFNAMSVGDSFIVPYAQASSVRVAMSVWAARHEGTMFVSRKQGATIRVWRVQ